MSLEGHRSNPTAEKEHGVNLCLLGYCPKVDKAGIVWEAEKRGWHNYRYDTRNEQIPLKKMHSHFELVRLIMERGRGASQILRCPVKTQRVLVALGDGTATPVCHFKSLKYSKTLQPGDFTEFTVHRAS